VYAHIIALRAHPCFGAARIVLVPEANVGNDMQVLVDMLMARIPLEVLCETATSYGVFTTPTIPQAYANRVMRRLDDGSIFFHRSLVSANPNALDKTPEERAAKELKKFETQMRGFEKVPIKSKSLLRIMRYAFTGKGNRAGERDGSKTDDGVMAYLIGTYWSAYAELGQLIIRRNAGRLLAPESMASAPRALRAPDDRVFASMAAADLAGIEAAAAAASEARLTAAANKRARRV